MGQKYSHPSNDTIIMSSSLSLRTKHKSGGRLDEGMLTSAHIPPAPLTKVKQATVTHLCTDCEFMTTTNYQLQRHRKHHDVKSAHQCPWCSYSVSLMPRLAVHVRYYHTNTDKKALATEKQSNAVARKKRAEEWRYLPSGRKATYNFCPDCVYKSTNKLNLDTHIKLMHPFSTKALQFLTLKNQIYKYNCAHCPFKTNHNKWFERHNACHGNKSTKHHCHLCNYSVNNRGYLALHLKLHYRETGENRNTGGQPKDRNNKITSGSYYSRNNRRYLLSCRDCRLFKTTSRFTLKRHVKRMHPFSLSALPPQSNKSKKINHPLRNNGLKVVQKAHQSGSREEWYIPPSGKRKRYLYCGDGNYRTATRAHLNLHSRAKHPSSISAIPARVTRQNNRDSNQEPSGQENSLIDSSVNQTVIMNRRINHPNKNSSCQVEAMGSSHNDEMPLQKEKNHHLHKCLECDYSTSIKSNMTRHKKSHQRNGKFKCSHCSFSSDFRSSIALHFKHGHDQNLNLLETRIQEVPSEERLRKQFGIKECRVILLNIRPLSVKVTNMENTKQLPPNKEADPITDYVPNLENAEQSAPYEEVDQVEENEGKREEDGKIQLLQIRIKNTEERARIADEEVKEISSKKTDLQKKIVEIEGRRALIECNLQIEQCNLLEIRLSALKTKEEPSEILMQSSEEEVKCLEDEMKVIDGELGALKEEEKSLDHNLEDSRGSHFEVVQVLEGLQSELDGLLVNINV